MRLQLDWLKKKKFFFLHNLLPPPLPCRAAGESLVGQRVSLIGSTLLDTRSRVPTPLERGRNFRETWGSTVRGIFPRAHLGPGKNSAHGRPPHRPFSQGAVSCLRGIAKWVSSKLHFFAIPRKHVKPPETPKEGFPHIYPPS